MWFLYFLCLVIVLVVDYFIAKEFADIAAMKGHEWNPYFWYTFVFGLVGMLMVIALPNFAENTTRKSKNTPPLNSSNEKTANYIPTVTHSWLCDGCKKMRTQSPCEHCGKD